MPAAALRRSLRCHGDLAHARREPALLNSATGVTPAQNFSWNHERAFASQHRPGAR